MSKKNRTKAGFFISESCPAKHQYGTVFLFFVQHERGLLMTDDERSTIVSLLGQIRSELKTATACQYLRIVASLIVVFLECVERFYARQLAADMPQISDILMRFERL